MQFGRLDCAVVGVIRKSACARAAVREVEALLPQAASVLDRVVFSSDRC